MKIYANKGIYGEDTVYVLETLEDFDEYEKIQKKMDPDFIKKFNPNFYEFKELFKMYVGKIWQDKNQLKYRLNGKPFYEEYKIISLEDDYSNMDWYWVVQNIDDDRDIKYVLGNSKDIEIGVDL